MSRRIARPDPRWTRGSVNACSLSILPIGWQSVPSRRPSGDTGTSEQVKSNRFLCRSYHDRPGLSTHHFCHQKKTRVAAFPLATAYRNGVGPRDAAGSAGAGCVVLLSSLSMDRYSGDIGRDLLIVSRNRTAERITGGLSNPGKMPERAWGIPAVRCKMGSLLSASPDSVCASCYAKKGRYSLRQVKTKLEERFAGLDHPLWVPAMVLLIRWYVGRYFRWFDAGDLQSLNHLANIAIVAEHTPEVLHWLPTQEHDIVRQFGEPLPKNLIVRLSSRTIDGEKANWPHTATVYTQTPPAGAHVCPALDQGNYCGACRACWDADVPHVAYQKH